MGAPTFEPSRSHPSRRRLGRLALAITPVLAAGLLTVAPAAQATGGCAHPSSSDATVVTDWNALALSTIAGDTTKDPRESFLYIGFVQAAEYNAVVGTLGRYEPYHFNAHAPCGASAVAAAAAAAHKVLVTYFPYATATLDAALATSLATVPDATARHLGARFGRYAAKVLIDQRANDGRYAPILFTKAPAPGVWRPTEPTFTPMAVPWMGFVTPLVTRSGAQFGRVGPPPALTSWRYTRDFNEVKKYGSATSTARTDDQTATAMFFSGNAIVQYDAALRDQVVVRNLDLLHAARMFAAVTMSQADAVINTWWAKYVYGFWRPITAIHNARSDKNPATHTDKAWTPLLTTPPYPDYVSGYSAVTGAFTKALGEALGTRDLQLTLISTAVPGATKSYDSARVLNHDVIDARVWLGIHFRFADTEGVHVGQEVADWALDHYFEKATD